MKGFFVPNSVSSAYVSSQRNDEGSYKYDSLANQAGIEKQTALQTLNKNYAQTINNAYSSYLSANRGIQGSAMGQGYKEAYIEANQEGLNQQIAEANMNAATTRQQLRDQETDAQNDITDMFKEEVANMDRVAKSMQDYLGYVKSLTGANGATTYLSPSQMNMSVDNLYEVLFNAQPQGYLDAEGNMGQTYIQWVNSQMKQNTADEAWSQWLFGKGGYQQFRDATQKGINQ